LDIPKIGTLGILLKARQIGLFENLQREIENLQKTGFSISQTVIDEILNIAGE